ncbi:MAG: hypothetical protein ACOYEF_02755 [Planifilum sp.]|jgi:hypothetical protein
MAAPEPTYDGYRVNGGTMAESGYSSCVRRASDIVADIVGCNAVTDEAAYLRAVYAAVDAIGDGGLSSVTVGSFSASCAGTQRSAEDEAYDAAFRVLATTGMAYGGIA